jgi:hypothetical protein
MIGDICVRASPECGNVTIKQQFRRQKGKKRLKTV